MKPFSHVVRRTHLYLTLFCLPWIVMYGVTSLGFSHPDWFDPGPNQYNSGGEGWVEEGSWPCTTEIPEGPVPREVAAELLAVAGVDADAFGAWRPNDRHVNVEIMSFWTIRRAHYRMDERRLILYSRKAYPRQILTSMHVRAGYQHDGVLNLAWAVLVDLVAIGFVLWVVTGIYIWWQLPKMRRWGALALGAGVLSFVALLLLL